jgi:hydrogenase maturation protein HypF
MLELVHTNDPQRLHIRITGLVQGVGFRPFVFRKAGEFGLVGFVENNEQGVDIEIEGERTDLERFLNQLRETPPPLAAISDVEVREIPRRSSTGFRIVKSEHRGIPSTRISPDSALCDDCRSELLDPADRRYRYPFINCTNCGPRYTIVDGIPYDRILTSMKVFDMCPDCASEYHDPLDRRFHAQPNACPNCGPKVWLSDSAGRAVGARDAVAAAQEMLLSGLIVAVKGLGGFHLAVDARDDTAVRRLRKRKGRAEKPFAVMAPDVEAAATYCKIDHGGEAALLDRRRPIVLLPARDDHPLAPSVAPEMSEFGVMLAYTPLHVLLLSDKFDALVMTSANLSEEPIAIKNDEAFDRLGNIADFFLFHDREILQRCDDSVVRVVEKTVVPIRRSRGYVPDPVSMPNTAPRPILACGGELKNTVALARERSVFLSQHVGDLDNPSAHLFFQDSIRHLSKILEISPEVVAYDLHPEYLSSKWALAQKDLEPVPVQHHHAHLGAVMAENGVTAPTIGIILDGTGYGTDDTIWGGEVLIGDLEGFERHAWLRPFPLPGGSVAIKQPWRTAAGLLFEASGRIPHELLDQGPISRLTDIESEILERMIGQSVNSPLTSSCGRLFDGVSSILGLQHEVTFEAQAAMMLEMAADSGVRDTYLDHPRTEQPASSGPLDWALILQSILDDRQNGVPVPTIAARFHRSLSDLFVRAAEGARGTTGINRVGLSGGVFQNMIILEDLRSKLTRAGFEVLVHSQVPTNDGGLAYGQAAIAAARMTKSNPGG